MVNRWCMYHWKGRPFQTGIVLGKKEYWSASTEDDNGINLLLSDLLVPWKPRVISAKKDMFTTLMIWRSSSDYQFSSASIADATVARVVIKEKAGSSPLDRLDGRNIFGRVWWPSSTCLLRNWTDQTSIGSRLDRSVARWKVPLENTQNLICLCFNFIALQRPTERACDVGA